MAKCTVLVIDDDPTILGFVKEALEDEGYTVLTAVDNESLSVVQEMQPSLILLDLMMPRMSGVEVSRQLRATPATAHIPIIAMSAYMQTNAPTDLQVDDWLVKPFDLDQLYDIVARWLPT